LWDKGSAKCGGESGIGSIGEKAENNSQESSTVQSAARSSRLVRDREKYKKL
jgi:hypothetical protein